MSEISPIICDEFENLFNSTIDVKSEVSKKILDELPKLELSVGNDTNNEINFPVCSSEVQRAVNRSKNGKAIGLDHLPYEIFKNPNSVSLLTKLFNCIYESGIIPSIWRVAIIKPIPKSSTQDLRIPTQYRAINLLSTVYKLFTTIINNRISQYLESNCLLADEQNGFRPNRNCDDHIFVLLNLLKNRKAKHLSTFVAFIDAEKAFDRVNRHLLLYKLLKAGITGKVYSIIKNIYQLCQCCVDINGHITQRFFSNIGVRQGDTLSPTLFNIFINDIVHEINSLGLGILLDNGERVSILLYADDIALLAESERNLQKMLDVIFHWGQNWEIKFNCNKSQVMHFRKYSVSCSNFVFKLGDNNLQTINEYKYLGLVFNEHLDIGKMATVLANSGNRALGAIMNKFNHLGGLSYNTYKKLYDMCVAPILDYSAGVWGHKYVSQIESVQNKAMKFFLGVHKFAPTDAVYGDLNWVSSYNRRKLKLLKY